jgi:N-acetylglucosaminyldiphosphoundecaprenol N-acetyl-beta-D-mannosaminyltransferase
MALASMDSSYKELLASGGVNLPDGKPLALFMNATQSASFEQVRGPSFFGQCLDRGREYGVRHFFLGGSADTLAALVSRARRIYPGIAIAGAASPPFRTLTEVERKEQDEAILASGAHIVWVGLGTPKQDFEAQRLRDALGLQVAAVGAAFDFFAGTKREAPRALRKLHLEWVFRLVSEPRRLWKRYLFGNSRFMLLAARQVFGGRK